jgi:hypothetical protein
MAVPQSPSNPFRIQPPPSMAFVQPQPTGVVFLQPQQTGFNPFRQSMMIPHATGGGAFFANANGAPVNGASSFQAIHPLQQPNASSSPSASNMPPFPSSFAPQSAAPTSSAIRFQLPDQPPKSVPTRPASTPVTNRIETQRLQPVKSHQTGSRNPFGAPVPELPPIPKAPTLMELAMMESNGSNDSIGNWNWGEQQQQALSGGLSTINGGSQMASVASSFLSNGDMVCNSAVAGAQQGLPIQPNGINGQPYC